MVQPHRGGARRKHEQHRGRTVDHLELLRRRRLLARWLVDARGDGRLVRRGERSAG
ncbi:50S ribosomal protein L34 [Mycolicibacterium sp. GF69]|nr:50S ribosomal protein L34 [Mycolicibacterium sp. GF69]